ncbi:patatin-like phospholipase family protein [Devosia sp.]|uniref:patatin-like phospholipase family protein n=1 Tax=Devosia sp. TaxID=1871048 RepID=UPI001AD0753D|nr:patatin-like phospholipase family protein [Devosia sp.]MBN9335294.1 patatin-like phospholipase family protein [Devosia sp.]
MNRFSATAAVLLVTLALSACSFAGKRPEIPLDIIASGAMAETSPLRYWGDDPEFAAGHTRVKPGSDGRIDFLTLSGGGINGAYGAGYLMGWTRTGTRPEFEVVTGISVGAIIAPLAFLGTSQDGRLMEVYRSLTTATNPKTNFLAALLGSSSILDNAPIRAAIEKAVDQEILDLIAKAHREGRRLYVGSTNLDAQRPVVWDIGAIANSNDNNRLELVRSVILASAAVPTVFPPVLIEVASGGQRYSELHVDGGVTEQVLLMPGGWGKVGGSGNAWLYVIFNGVVDASAATVQPSGMALIGRSVPTLLKYLGRANLAELANSARTSGVQYRMTAIPGDFPESDGIFGSPEWLSRLYDFGFAHGNAEYWREKIQ